MKRTLRMSNKLSMFLLLLCAKRFAWLLKAFSSAAAGCAYDPWDVHYTIQTHRQTDRQAARQPNDRWCWTRAARIRYVCYVAFLSFFPIPLFTAKGAYELISIANLRFWPGLSATPLRQWNANKYRRGIEGRGGNQQQIPNQIQKMTARKQGQQHMAA